MVKQHYRWDFIGLSTDEKPTPATSENVVDGSTFYCSDTSKLYVFCKDTWYERKALGGGGTTYTAGFGIDIENDEISVDDTEVQPKLTAGTNITIENNTISATGGGTSYTAGFGIDIENDEISVDDTEVQPKLTAGENITITNNTISATSGGGGGEPDYSTSEVDTGTKWIDGSTIYKKTIAVGPLPSSGTWSTNMLIGRLNLIIKVEGFWGTGLTKLPLIYPSPSNINQQITVSFYENEINVLSNDRTGLTGYATVYYTKTQ